MKRNVIIKEPGKDPRPASIQDSLASLQSVVGGYLETVYVSNDTCILCNEEGAHRLPRNCFLFGHQFYGTLIFIGLKRGNFTDYPTDFETFMRDFPLLFKRRFSNGN